jgi:RNA polymerase sigma factor (sigma-70 family)
MDGRTLARPGASASSPSGTLDHTLIDAEASDMEGVSLAPGPGADLIERLFQSQSKRLLRFIKRRSRHPNDAADLLNDAFVRLTRLLASGPLPTLPKAYLQQIVVNLLKDEARRSESHCEDLHVSLDEAAYLDPSPGPADYLEAQDVVRLYEASVMRLRPKTREIFLLHRRDSLTYVQIAAQVGLSVSGVEKHMMKAIAQIDRDIGRPW